jgi:hypothetical protein
MPNIKDIHARWGELKEKYPPKIREAREEVEAASAELAAARERHSVAVDKHQKLVGAYNDRWSAATRTGR